MKKKEWLLTFSLITSIIILIALFLLRSPAPYAIHTFGPNEQCTINTHYPNNYKFITVSTGSMSPTINPNDTVIAVEMAAIGAESLKVGDIIVFEKGPDLICHRITEIREGGLITKGDANSQSDSLTPFEDVRGKVLVIFK